jgi:electron transport complex protein RnfG
MKEIIRSCYVLVVIGAVCAVAMAFVDQKTRDPIEASGQAAKIEPAKTLFPGFDNNPVRDAVVVRLGPKDSTIFYRFMKSGKMMGAAFTVTAPSGYGGPIEILVAVDPTAVIRGIEILSQKETDGLGSKITLPQFKEQFEGKSINDPANWTVERDGGPFKQVTGATISSRAVTSAIAGGLEVLESHKDTVFPGQVAPANKAPAKASSKEKVKT